jgi:hypothetical protein
MLPINPMAILKGSKFFIIAALVSYGLWFVHDYRKDQIEQRDALITANATAVSAEARAQAIAIANAQLEAVNKAQTEALLAAAKAQEEMAEKFADIQKTQIEQKALLEGDRLQNAVRGKRELVERLANRATRERFDEVENIFDGT